MPREMAFIGARDAAEVDRSVRSAALRSCPSPVERTGMRDSRPGWSRAGRPSARRAHAHGDGPVAPGALDARFGVDGRGLDQAHVVEVGIRAVSIPLKERSRICLSEAAGKAYLVSSVLFRVLPDEMLSIPR